MLKKILLKIFYYLPIKFLLKNYIIFESNPDFADNTYYVYQELLRQGYNKKYKFIWLVTDKDKFGDIHIDNVVFVNINSMQAKRYRMWAKFIIDSNRYINKYNKYQYRFHLGHGMPIKVVMDYTRSCGKVDNYLVTSDYFIPFFSDSTKIAQDKFLPLGFPRTDQFFMPNEQFKELAPYDKVILWMPTYRKHVVGLGYKSSLVYGVPSINNKKELLALNVLLKKYNSLLLIKLHPAEDTNELDKMNLTNILFTKNELLEKNKKNIYELASVTDALITDYSSVYFDYLLHDKPIGMAIEDICEFGKNFSLFFDNFEEQLPGEYIYNYHDLEKFITNVCNGKDIKRKIRNEKRSIYVKYNDGNSSKRIVDILKRHSL